VSEPAALLIGLELSCLGNFALDPIRDSPDRLQIAAAILRRVRESLPASAMHRAFVNAFCFGLLNPLDTNSIGSSLLKAMRRPHALS
jgi:hypothetical protein